MCSVRTSETITTCAGPRVRVTRSVGARLVDLLAGRGEYLQATLVYERKRPEAEQRVSDAPVCEAVPDPRETARTLVRLDPLVNVRRHQPTDDVVGRWECLSPSGRRTSVRMEADMADRQLVSHEVKIGHACDTYRGHTEHAGPTYVSLTIPQSRSYRWSSRGTRLPALHSTGCHISR